MKAIILAISILISTAASSQVYFNCYRIKSGTKIGDKWKLGDAVSTDLTFVVTPRKISVNDKAQSVYRIYSEPEESKGDGFKVSKWMALDEVERRVSVESVTYDSGEFVLIIRYLDTMYVYYLNLIESTP